MSSFDSAAPDYDEEFTNTAIGKYQRKTVWNYLDSFLESNFKQEPLNILELNAGTGEDALWFARKGHNVTLTDVSSKMLEVAKKKIEIAGFSSRVSFLKLDLNEMETFKLDAKFDLIFSNFAGLNCLDKTGIKEVFKSCESMLKPNGEFILVFLGKFCLWETIYFLAKVDLKNAWRRSSDNSVMVDVSGEKVKTWYYSIQEIEQLCSTNFETQKVRAIGSFVPPSYLNTMFGKDSLILKILNRLDDELGHLIFMKYLSDHYLLHLKKK